MEPLPEPLPLRPIRQARGQLRTQIALFLTAFLLILLVSSSSAALATELFRPVPVTSLGGCLLLALAVFAALVVHELGHLGAAVICGFDVLTVRLGLLRFTNTQFGWRFHLRSRRVFTGSVSAVPRSNERWRERNLFVVAAGPLATLSSALLAACLLHTHVLGQQPLTWFLLSFFQISFVIFLLGLFPLSSGESGGNDAALFRDLWRDREGANSLFLYQLVVQHQRTGLQPGQFPLWLIELMATYSGRPEFMAFYAGMVASWAFDRGQNSAGDLWDGRALDLSAQTNLATRYACLANSACFDLVFRSDVDAAKAKLARIDMESLASPLLLHRARAARDLAFGRIAGSFRELSAARSYLPTPAQGGFDWFLLKRLHASALATR